MKRTLIFSMLLLMLSLTVQAGDPVAQMTFRVTDDLETS